MAKRLRGKEELVTQTPTNRPRLTAEVASGSDCSVPLYVHDRQAGRLERDHDELRFTSRVQLCLFGALVRSALQE